MTNHLSPSMKKNQKLKNKLILKTNKNKLLKKHLRISFINLENN